MNQDSPLISAVVTTYNRQPLVRRALDSVYAQTYENLEVIVVEDGSNSGISDWIAQNEMKPTRYVRHHVNRGLAAARNTGINEARGEYLAFLDDDDVWNPEKTKEQVACLNALSHEQRMSLGVIYCGCEIRSQNQAKYYANRGLNQGPLKQAIMAEGARTVPSSCLFPKQALLNVGGYDEQLVSSVDHDIWMSLANAGYAAYLLDKLLVVTYVDYAWKTMTGDTLKRVAGVRSFTQKWMPVYQEWFGVKEGQRYGYRYYARVIARLASQKLITGHIADAVHAIRAIYRFSPLSFYNARQIALQFTIHFLSKIIPIKMKKVARETLRQLSAA